MEISWSVEEILATLPPNEKEKTSHLVNLLEEIKINTSAKPNAYIHLLLREKYFILIQNIIESSTGLITLIKFVFNCLQKFLLSESTCELCALKEKSQFLLNIFKYVQHSHINDELVLLEVFKFLLNNHEVIEVMINSKVLASLFEIGLNQFESNSTILQSSSKALIIKYTSVVCNQISSLKSKKYVERDLGLEKENFDLYLVNVFTSLLNQFNQEFRSYELRALILECIELLLNNLLAEANLSNTSYNIKKSNLFIKFAWQQFCPSILFQFGDCGLPSKELAPQSISFKQIYTILIQLTGLIGGCKSMISVFEAIYQRILFYTPELDRPVLLKIFKSSLDEKFLLSLCTLEDDTQGEESSKTEPISNDFTLINLIIGFYRNCYEKSLKPPQNKILQLLSCECIGTFIELLYSIFEKDESNYDPESTVSMLSLSIINKKLIKQSFEFKNIDPASNKLIKKEALEFFNKFSFWLNDLIEKCDDRSIDVANNENSMQQDFNLDLEIKKFCLSIMSSNTIVEPEKVNSCDAGYDFRKKLGLNSYKLYATTYFSIYKLFKSSNEINKLLDLSNFNFEETNQSHKEYFMYRILSYGDIDDSNENDAKQYEFKIYFRHWINYVYGYLKDLSDSKAIKDFTSTYKNFQIKRKFKIQLNLILKQMDCLTKINLKNAPEVFENDNNNLKSSNLDLIRKLLRSSWPYLIDVLTGVLLNSNLNCIENVLFNTNTDYLLINSSSNKNAGSELPTTVSTNIIANNSSLTDLSLVLFAYKACMDSLIQIIKIVTNLSSMDKELNQIFFLLISNPFKTCLTSTNSNQLNKISLNHIVCLDFVLNTTLGIVCNVDFMAKTDSDRRSFLKYRNLQAANHNTFEVLWKYLIEAMFFCFYLQANMNDELAKANFMSTQSNDKEEKDNVNGIPKLSKKRDSAFKSVYSNLNDVANNDESFNHKSIILHSNSIDGSLDMKSSSIITENELSVSKFLIQQRKVLFRDLFLFLNRKLDFINETEIKTGTKCDVINSLAHNVYDYLYSFLFQTLDNYVSRTDSVNLENTQNFELDLLDFIWHLSSHMCHFSKRFLLEETYLRSKHEYFTFNNLIIDKIDELLLKLIEKLTSNSSTDINSTITHCDLNLDVSSLLIPQTNNQTQQINSTYSIFSIFVNDIWLNIFLSYFVHICSKSGLIRSKNKKKNRKSKHKNEAGENITKSSSISQFLIHKAKLTRSSISMIKSLNERKANKQLEDSYCRVDYFLVDFSICKKLICLIQKVFETYNINNLNLSYLKIATNRYDNSLKEYNVIKSPISSSCSNVSTPTRKSDLKLDLSNNELSNDNLIFNNEFIAKLEMNKRHLVRKIHTTNSDGDIAHNGNISISSHLLHTATTSIIMPPLSPTNEQIEIYLVDEYLNFNSLFLLPFKSLMHDKKLDMHLKDCIIASLCELVESSSNKVKTSWNCLFSCLSKIDLNSHLMKKDNSKTSKTKKLKSKLKKQLKKQQLRNKPIAQPPINNLSNLEKAKLNSIRSFDSDVSSNMAKSFESTSQLSDKVINSSRSNSNSSLNSSSTLSSQSSGSESSLSPVLSRTLSTESLKKCSSASNTESDGSTSSASSSRSQSPTISSLNFTNISYKFDSYRMRLNSLVDIFNIYLSIASNSNYILENGVFDFIKCVTNYLQYSPSIKLQSVDKFNNLFDLEYINSTEVTTNTNHVETSSVDLDEPGTAKASQNDLNLCQNDEDLYLCSNEVHQITSNYDYLIDLSNANNSNTLIKPFLICIEKLFNILLKNLVKSLNDIDMVKETNLTLSQLILINKKSFKTSDYEFKEICILNNQLTLAWLTNNPLSFYDINYNENDFVFQNELAEEFDLLNKKFKDYVILNDRANLFKIIVYLIESLSSRVYLSIDELNCVQLVEFIFKLLTKLLSLKQFSLVSYCVLQILLVDLNGIINLIEFKKQQQNGNNSEQRKNISIKNFVYRKLYDNTFFLSNLIKKQIEKIVDLVSDLTKAYAHHKKSSTDESSMIVLFLNCIKSRLTFILTKSVVRKLAKFDSIVDLTFINSSLTKLYFAFFKLNDLDLNAKCLNSIKMFHFLSMLPLKTIIANYSYEDNKSGENNDFFNFEVLTKKCLNSWQLYNVKNTYNMAKDLLYYEQITNIENDVKNIEQMNSEENVEDKKLDDLALKKDDELLNDFQTINENSFKAGDDLEIEEEDDNQFKNSNDDKSFYRDFTLKFHISTSDMDKESNYKMRKNKLFNIDPSESENDTLVKQQQTRQINLTSLIVLFKFHFEIISMMRKFCINLNDETLPIASGSSKFPFELLKCLNETYLTSLKLDYILSFKILMSKIFYLNCDNSLANFVNLTKMSYLSITSMFFKYHLANYLRKKSVDPSYFESLAENENIQLIISLIKNTSTASLKSKTSETFDEKLINKLENQMEKCLRENEEKNENTMNKYYFYFIQHFCIYYLYLNEKSHNFKLERSYLLKLLNNEESTETEGEIKDEIKQDESNIPKSDSNSKIEQNSEIDRKVIELFKLHKQQNKALTMFNLTKKTEFNVKKLNDTDNNFKRLEANGDKNSTDSNDESNASNDNVYFQRDARFRYQVWSNEMISYFILGLSAQSEQKANDTSFQNILKVYQSTNATTTMNQPDDISTHLLTCLSELIVVFNSCSSYCQCAVIVESNIKTEIEKVKNTSAQLLTLIFQIVKDERAKQKQ